MTVSIWHNPRCSKSRQTLALLIERGIEPDIRLYLTDAPSAAELDAVLDALGFAPSELVRKGEKAFKELGLVAAAPEKAFLDAMVANPTLIERPIVVVNGKAAVGRPPEAVLELL